MRTIGEVLRPRKIPAGRYTYRGTDKLAGMALQLRVERGGRGIMVINANTVLHLNETASAYAYFFMQGMPETEILRKIRGMYRVNPAKAKDDYEELVFAISTLASTEKVDPVSYLGVGKEEPFTYKYSAPLRMDMALTFKCQNECIHCYTGGSHETNELNTEQWKKIIDKVSQIGVFIATFTGGESTLRPDLPELLQYAQTKGLVTGLITNGRKLKDKTYVRELKQAGLDFVQITLESHLPEVHDAVTGAKGSWKETIEGIKNAARSEIYVTTNTTINRQNASDILETVQFIKTLDVAAFGCNSLIHSGKGSSISSEFAIGAENLIDLLPKIHSLAGQLGLKFLWYTPTQYCRLDPVKLGLGVKACTAAMINMCISPQGDVYPCQSYFETLGNILKNTWEEIWNNPLAVKLRKREYVELKCKDCPQLQICGGGCPLELQGPGYACGVPGQ